MTSSLRQSSPVFLSFVFIAATVSTAAGENPALERLVEASSDVLVVTVEDTHPRLAVEGRRDTVKLRVDIALKGSIARDAVVPVYYALLWIAPNEVEPPKFRKGKSYIVALKSHQSVDAGVRRTEYKFTDDWLSVQNVHPRMVREIETIVRTEALPRIE